MDKARGEKKRAERFGLVGANKAQMAIVFLVLIFVALIFYGVVAGWNKMASSRTQVTMASNMGASTLASYMSSYGQKIINEDLDQQTKKCDWTGLMLAIFSLIALSAYILAGQASGILAVLAVSAAVASVSVQGSNIQPMMSTAWSTLQNKDLLKEDRFVEAGIQAALPLAVSDSVTVTDDNDFNMNGSTDDKINRFSSLYSKRVWYTQVPMVGGVVQGCQPFKDFQEELKNLAVDLGLYWPACENGAGTPTGIGDPCCVPADKRASTCPDEPDCEPLGPAEDWPYDPGYCGSTDESTLLGFIGTDDGNNNRKTTPNLPGSFEESYPVGEVTGWDSTGLLFPWMWELHDSVMDISQLTSAASDDPGCHWCSLPGGGTASCNNPMLYNVDPALNEKADLPGCTGAGCCVGQVDDSGYFLDKVAMPALLEETTNCPQVSGYTYFSNASDIRNCVANIQDPSSPTRSQIINSNTLWRPGWNSGWSIWPYYNAEWNLNMGSGCWQEAQSIKNDSPGSPNPPSVGASFNCGETINADYFTGQCGCWDLANDKGAWLNDDFDAMAVNLRKMVTEMSQVHDMECSTASLETVYDLAIQWVSYLHKMQCDLMAAREIYVSWLNDQVHFGDWNTWCYPQAFTNLSQSEFDAISTAANGNWGNLDSVLACLDYNANNQQRFLDCYNNCIYAIWDGYDNWGPNYMACEDLPRSPYPDPMLTAFPTSYLFNSPDGCFGEFEQVLLGTLELNASYQAVGLQRNANRYSQRLNYLKEVKARLEDPDTGMLQGLQDMADSIDAALTRFEPKVQSLCNQLNQTGSPETVYYVWSSQLKPGQAVTSRMWHAVKVDAAIPKRCNGQCGTDRFPWIRTYTRSYGFLRCWGLTDTDGAVSLTAARYDDDRDPISVLNGATAPAVNSALENACGGGELGAYISCAHCSSFTGRLEDNGGCMSAVQSAIANRGHSVKTTGTYTLNSGEYELSIQQQ